VRADGHAERPMERVSREVGGVDLTRAETTELARDLPRAHARHLEDGASANERDGGAASGHRGAAPLAVEARVGNPIALDDERETQAIAARGAPGRAREGVGGHVPEALRGLEVVGEAFEVHPAQDTRAGGLRPLASSPGGERRGRRRQRMLSASSTRWAISNPSTNPTSVKACAERSTITSVGEV
jgi:hypothetical protein